MFGLDVIDSFLRISDSLSKWDIIEVALVSFLGGCVQGFLGQYPAACILQQSRPSLGSFKEDCISLGVLFEVDEIGKSFLNLNVHG